MLFALTAAMGLVLGLLGGGGSILAVPVFMYAAGLEPRTAIAASLPVVAAAAVAALPARAAAGEVRWRVGWVFAGAGMVGAHLGGRAAHLVPQRLLLGGFAVVMVVSAVFLLRCRRCDGDPAGQRESRPSGGGWPWLRWLAQGVAVGVLTGLLGVGGGFLIVPALTLLAGLPIRSAAATSLLVIALNSLAGFSGHLAGAVGTGGSPVSIASLTGTMLPLALAAALGGFAGSQVAGRIPQRQLRRSFAIVVLVLATSVTYRVVYSPATKEVPVFSFFRSRASGAQARALVAGGAALVDVRSPAEYQEGHLEGAISIPVDQIEGRAHEIGGLDRTIVVYCRSGMRSARARATLRRLGFSNVFDLGPKSAW